MASTIKLRKEHLAKIAEIMVHVVEWKSQHLKPESFAKFETNWLPSFLQQLESNEWRLNHSQSNTFKWINDQIYHSRRLAPGVTKTNAVFLNDTRLGREVIEICTAAAKGQLYYDSWAKNSEFNNLFN